MGGLISGYFMPGCVQSGTDFPDGQAFEKCVPEFAFGMGRSFPLRCFAESASHSGRSKWDTLSQRRSNGKLRPIIRSRNGMHFPNESKTGKCIPQSALKVGRRFPMRRSTENTSQKWPLSWDKISAASRILKMRHAVGENETRDIGHRMYHLQNESTPLE